MQLGLLRKKGVKKREFHNQNHKKYEFHLKQMN